MSLKKIIGRDKEISRFDKLYNSSKSEFVAVYGRRRVGKTYLIKELYGQEYSFYTTGLSKAKLNRQLSNFHTYLTNFDQAFTDQEIPKDWFSAFQLLIKLIEKKTDTNRKVIFIDELPWLDTPKSEFISALENFWNGWAYHRDDILLIVCGSATSWMINELINHHGGLHNRVTARIHLKPFNLQETELFLQAKGGVYGRYQIVQLYMAMGGIPFYLESVDVKRSIPQNIEDLYFNEDGLLRGEFYNLFRSLFKKEERHIAIIEALAEKAKGLSRKDLVKAAQLANGGTFTKILKELEQCGFIKKYIPFGKKKNRFIFRLTDPYSLFYLKFVKNSMAMGRNAWLTQLDSPKWRAWSGYAFEYLCFYHIQNIKKKLDIGAVYTEISTWHSKAKKDGVQIDLIIDRRDRVINLCEIKFSIKPYVITKKYGEQLQHKINVFRAETSTTKTIFLTFITTFGLKENNYATTLVQNNLTIDAFFESI